MPHRIAIVVIIAIALTAGLVGEARAEEYQIEEFDLEGVVVEPVEPAKTGEGEAPAAEAAAETETKEPFSDRYLSSSRTGREGRFRAGLVAPGLYAGNKSIDLMATFGIEGEYFFFDRLSAGLRMLFATDFKKDAKPNAILSFIPQARYVFDVGSSERWAIYVQGGVGITLLDGDTVAADIMIPGGGFWWKWTERWSVGADAALHVLARSSTAIAFHVSPALRYTFF